MAAEGGTGGSGVTAVLGELIGGIHDVLQGGPGGWNPPRSPEEAARRIERIEGRIETAPTDKKLRQYQGSLRALTSYSIANWGVSPSPPPLANPPVPVTPVPGAPPPYVEPTTDISAILKRMPSLRGLGEWLSRYRLVIGLLVYSALSEIVQEYNLEVAKGEAADAKRIKELDKEAKRVRDQAIKDARESYRFGREQAADRAADAAKRAREQHEAEAREVSRAAWENAQDVERILRSAKQRYEELKIRERARDKALADARRAAAKAAKLPPGPPFKSRRVQLLEAAFGVLGAVSGRRQALRVAKAGRSPGIVIPPSGQGQPFLPGGDLLQGFSGLTGFDVPALDFATGLETAAASSTAEEVCSCRPRYPRRRRRKRGERRICYTRKD